MNVRVFRNTALACSLVLLSCLNTRAEDAAPKQPQGPSSRLPEIFAVHPAGGTRGATVEVEILGENLDGAKDIELGGEGVTAEIIESSSLHARARITVDSQAEASLRSVRITSSLGVSNILGFRVGELPEVLEVEPNNDRDTAQQLQSPTVVDAILFPDEDADFYRFHAHAGERLIVEVLGARAGSGLNSQIFLLDSAGRRVAVGDDEAGFDPVIEHVFEKEGDYCAVVRGVFNVLNITFPTGHPAYVYQFRVFSPPVLENVTTSSLTQGPTSEIEISGKNLDAVTDLAASKGVTAKITQRTSDKIRATITADAATTGFKTVWAVSPRGPSSPVRVAVSPSLPITSESDAHETIRLPGIIEGEIEKPGEQDAYAFTVTEPGAYVFEVEAGRLNSLLDSILTLKDAKGDVLVTNDDDPGGEGDSRIMYRFFEPGDYRLEIKQAILNLHGPDYRYRLVARKARPRFTLSAAGGGQATPWSKSSDRLIANPGSKISIPVKVTWIEGLQSDGTGIDLRVEGLPETIVVEPFTADVHEGKFEDNSRYSARFEIPVEVPTGFAIGNYSFHVKGEAKAGGEVLAVEEVIGASASGRYVMSASGGFSQTVPNRYLSVVEPVEFTLRPEIGDERYPIRFTIQPGTSKTLPLTVLSPEFPERLDFAAENLPRGLTIQQVEADPKTKQYVLHLKADADGERGWFPIVTFVATDEATGAKIPAPYFGLSVQ